MSLFDVFLAVNSDPVGHAVISVLLSPFNYLPTQFH